METNVTSAKNQELDECLNKAFKAAKHYLKRSRSEATWRAYRSDWRVFQAWCEEVDLSALPASPMTLQLFLANQAQQGLHPSTLNRRLAAIRIVHLGSNHPSPHNTLPVIEIMRGIRRDRIGGSEGKTPLTDDLVKLIIKNIPSCSLTGLRNRALLLIGFCGALRRSELVGVDMEHIEYHSKGIVIRIPHSKTDQEGKGQDVGILAKPGSDYCPLEALDAWVKAANIELGPVFTRIRRGGHAANSRLSAQSVALIVKKNVQSAGLNPALYSGHSLRSGFLTSAARSRADLLRMADHSRHVKLDTLRSYVKPVEIFDDHAGQQVL